MSSDDQGKQGGPERKNLLEEIRRRAEEAELRRIEDEEKDAKAAGGDTAASAAPFEPTLSPVPSAEPTPVSSKTADEQKIAILRERLIIALDRGKGEKAAELLSELMEMNPHEPELAEFQSKNAALQERMQQARKRKRVPEPRPKEPTIKEREKLEAERKQIADLLAAAGSLYQQEKYEQGLEKVDRALALDPDSQDAQKLRLQILKAHHLAELIKREESRRKADEAASLPPDVGEAVPLSMHEDKDIWGTAGQVQGEPGYELAPEEKGPVGPPKPPLVQRIIARVSKIRIPVKPLMIVGTIIVVGVLGYYIVQNILNAVSPPRFSLLILPVTIVSSDSSLAYIGDGLTEDLVTDLASISELRVIGAPSTFALRGSTLSTPKIAKSLGASHYLQWSLVRSAESFILQTSFYDTASPKPVWGARLQTSFRELTGTRHELARKLLSTMGVRPGAEEEEMLRRVPTLNPLAYDAYLRGRAVLRQSSQYPASSAIELFSQAIQADPSFGDAHAALGWAYMTAYENETGAPASFILQASGQVQRAIGLGAKTSETFRVWGIVDQYHSQVDKARERFEEAVRLSPSDAESQRRLATIYIMKGQYEAALKAAQHAANDDPANLISFTMLGNVQQFLGQYVLVSDNESKESKASLTAALHSYEQAMRFAPDRSEYSSGIYADVLVYVQQPDRAKGILRDRVARARDSYIDHYRLGRVGQSAGSAKQEWQAVFLRARDLLKERLQAYPDDGFAYSYLALVQTRLGEFKEALAASNHALEIAGTDVNVLYNTARMYALQHGKNQALEYLERATARRYSLAHILDMDFYNLRSDPDFVKTISG